VESLDGSLLTLGDGEVAVEGGLGHVNVHPTRIRREGRTTAQRAGNEEAVERERERER